MKTSNVFKTIYLVYMWPVPYSSVIMQMGYWGESIGEYEEP